MSVFRTFTPAELAAAFALEGIEPVFESPAAAWRETAPAPARADGNADWVALGGRKRLIAAMAARPVMHARAFALDGFEEHYAFVAGPGEIMVTATIGPGSIAIGYPVERTELLSAFAQLLTPTEAAPPLNVSLELTHAGFLALAAYADYFKTLFAASLMERRGLDAVLFTLDHLESQMATANAIKDYRWLCALVPHLAPDGPAPALEAGCRELVGFDLMGSESRDGVTIYRPSPALFNIALQFLNPLPAVLFRLPSAAKKPSHKQTAILNGRTLWWLEFGSKKALLHSVDGLGAMAVIARHVTAPAGFPAGNR